MRALALLALLAATSAEAMTPADCDRWQGKAAGLLPWVGQLKLDPRMTEDGFCRVMAGDPALQGLEWLVSESGDDITASLRQKNVTLPGFGAFSGAAMLSYDAVEKTLTLRQGDLLRQNGDGARAMAVIGGVDATRPGTIGEAELRATQVSLTGVASEILARAFRLDLSAAKSSFIAARDQRKTMQAWLDALPAGIGDAASREAFRQIVRAYPTARGTATLSVSVAEPVKLGTVLNAVLFGASLTNAQIERLAGDAGLMLRWQPD